MHVAAGGGWTFNKPPLRCITFARPAWMTGGVVRGRREGVGAPHESRQRLQGPATALDPFFRGHGEFVGPVVSALVGPGLLYVCFDLSPAHFPVAFRRLEEPLPEVLVRHRLFAMVEP